MRKLAMTVLALGALWPAALAQTAPTARTCTLTPAETEGPYYTPGAPARSDLAADVRTGTPLTVSGQVLDQNCQPLRGATVDVWQADAEGQYDNSGYTLRGKVTTDARGRYTFQTVVPGEYPGRTPHIHVKVTAPGGRTLTTQLYIPGLASNARDRIYQAQMQLQNYRLQGGRATATYTFVVQR
ncbi:dioxygenase family protein [Deinococcus aerius]|nr:carboxypeptidase regulatory-like domain-containing protein [Deinococcus aerius]